MLDVHELGFNVGVERFAEMSEAYRIRSLQKVLRIRAWPYVSTYEIGMQMTFNRYQKPCTPV